MYTGGDRWTPCPAYGGNFSPKKNIYKDNFVKNKNSFGRTKRSTLLGGQRRTNGSNMGEPMRTRKGKLMEKASTIHNWVVWCKSKNGAQEIR